MRFLATLFLLLFLVSSSFLLYVHYAHLQSLKSSKHSSSLRKTIQKVQKTQQYDDRQLWREDGWCGPLYPMPAVADDGRIVIVAAGCNTSNPNNASNPNKYCCSKKTHKCSLNSLLPCTSGAAPLSLSIVQSTLGLKANAYNLSGSEWRRQDFRCGSFEYHVTLLSMWQPATRTIAACDPDSSLHYFCNSLTHTCTIKSAVDGVNDVDDAGVDYRLLKNWITWNNYGARSLKIPKHHRMSVNLLIQQQEDIYRRNIAAIPPKTPEQLIQQQQDAYNRRTIPFLSELSQQKNNQLNNNNNAPIMKTLRWYFINLATHRQKGKKLATSLINAGVKRHQIHRIEAVTPTDIVQQKWNVPSNNDWDDSLPKAVSLSHLKAIKQAWDDDHVRREHGLLGHDAIIVEDDLSLDLLRFWELPIPTVTDSDAITLTARSKGLTLSDVLESLHNQKEDNWEICQLSITLYWSFSKHLSELASKLSKGSVVLPRRSKHHDLWGAVAYLISPRGQARILDILWPGGKDGPAYDALPRNTHFPWPSDRENVADYLLYTTTLPGATYVATRPLFTSATTSSHVHDSHVYYQQRSKYLVESVLYFRTAQYVDLQVDILCVDGWWQRMMLSDGEFWREIKTLGVQCSGDYSFYIVAVGIALLLLLTAFRCYNIHRRYHTNTQNTDVT